MRLLSIIFSIFTFFILINSSFSEEKIPEYSTDVVIVSVTDERALYNDYPVKKHLFDSIYSVYVPEGKDVEKFMKELREKPYVEFVQPNYVYQLFDTIPDDTFILEQWGLASIDAFRAWDIETGSDDVVVAVVDDGVDYTHPDLINNIWKNTDEICNDGFDNDNNGYIDDCYGWNAFSEIGSGEYHGTHGTHVAGIIGAVGNNNLGISGVSWNVKILPCTAGNIFLYDEDIAECFAYILKQKFLKGINVVAINASFGSYRFSKAAEKAIKILDKFGIILVAAAGNSLINVDKSPMYPCAYKADNVICVGATDRLDKRAFFSNYGFFTVDIFAPGENILSTIPYEYYNSRLNVYGYKEYSGTSMAAPFVTGAIALLKSYEPDLSPEEIKERILATSEPVSYLYGSSLTCGKLNIYNLLTDTSHPKFCMNLPVGKEYLFSYGNENIVIKKGIIRNTGRGTLSINGVSLSNSQYFHILQDECTGKSLKFLEECEIKIAYTYPFAVKSIDFDKVETILSVSSSEGTYNFNLTGSISTNPSRGKYLDVSKVEIFFKNVSVGSDKTTLLKIKNTYNKTVALRFHLGDKDNFYIDPNPSEKPCGDSPILEENDYCFIKVGYSPEFSGDHFTILSIISEDPEEDDENKKEIGYINVNIKGSTITTPEIALIPDDQIIKLVKSKKSTRVEKEIRIKNTGNSTLNILDIDIVGNTGDFYLDTVNGPDACNPIVSLPPGEECSFKIVFTGDEKKKNYSAFIRIKSNDKLEENKFIYVIGIVDKPKIKVEPSKLDFGKLMVGKDKEQIIKIYNTLEDYPLTLTKIQLENGISSEFSVDTFGGDRPCGSYSSTILEQDYCTISVIFNPTTSGKKSKKLIIQSGEDTKEISIKAEALEPVYPLILVNPDRYDFGSVIVGQTEEKIFEIKNDGFADLVITDIKTGKKGFSLDLHSGSNPCGYPPITIQQGQKCTFKVSFSPQKDSEYKSSIEIRSNDQINKKLKVEIYGKGRYQSPIIEVSPSEYDFGTVFIGQSKEKEFTLENTGELQLVVSEIKSKNKSFSVDLAKGTNPCGSLPVILDPGQFCNFTVTFSPLKEKREKTSIEFKSNDKTNKKFRVNLYGTGLHTAPVIDLNVENAVDMGKIVPSNSSEKVIKISNTGNAALTIYQISLKSKDSIFSIDPNGGDKPCGTVNDINVPPGDYCTFKVIFAPVILEEYKARLEIKSNDPGRKKIKLDLIGHGRPPSSPSIKLSTREIQTEIPVDNACDLVATILIKNIGEQNLEVTEKDVTKNLETSLRCGFFVEPGETCSLYVWLSKSECEKPVEKLENKKFKGKITLETNDPVEEEITIDVYAYLYNPDDIYEDNIRHLKISIDKSYPTEAYTYVGEVSFPYVISIKNTSSTLVNVEDIYLSDNEEFDLKFEKSKEQSFYVDPTTLCKGKQFTLLPGEECKVLVYMTPKVEGRKDLTIYVKESSGAINELRITTSAFLPKQRYVYIDPEIYDEFPKIPPNDQSGIGILKVRNIRETSVKIQKIELVSAGEFELVSGVGSKPCATGYEIQPESFCSIGIRFKPVSAGIKNATVKVFLEDGNIIISRVYGRSSTSSEPHIVITPRQIYTGLLFPNLVSQMSTITIKNIGDDILSVTNIYASNAGKVLINLNYGDSPCGSRVFSLNPGDECTIGVLYQPEKTTDLESAVYIESNDPLFPLAEIKIYSESDERLFAELPDRGCGYGTVSVPLWLIAIVIVLLSRRLKKI